MQIISASLCLSFPVTQCSGDGRNVLASCPQFHFVPGLSGPSSPGAWRRAGVCAGGCKWLAFQSCSALPCHVSKAHHLCKNVPILSPFQLCGCESMTQGDPHPGTAFNRPWSPLPGKVPQDSHPPCLGPELETCCVCWCSAPPGGPSELCSSRPQSPDLGAGRGLGGPSCRGNNFLSFWEDEWKWGLL